jgi:hypothetical protein
MESRSCMHGFRSFSCPRVHFAKMQMPCEMGVRFCLSKPVRRKELLAAILASARTSIGSNRTIGRRSRGEHFAREVAPHFGG